MTTILLIILSIFFPPLAIAIKGGRKPKLLPFFINLSFVLFAGASAIAGFPFTLLFILIAIAHAIWVICATE